MKSLLSILSIIILFASCQKECKDANIGIICIQNSTSKQIICSVDGLHFPLISGGTECYNFAPGEYQIQGFEYLSGASGASLSTKTVNVKACKTRDVEF